jgi:hypothetical protein
VNSPATLAEVLAAMKRIEARQDVFEQVLRRFMGALEIHNEKLDAILEAATREPGPSPVAALLGDILTSMKDQTRLLEELPGALAETIRDELAKEIEAEGVEMEPAEPWAFDQADEPANDGAAIASC